MTQEQYEKLYNWVYEEIHHNRDSYSRSKIIEMIMHRAEELVNKTNDIHDVSHCPLCGSDDLFQYKLQHIHCQKCNESFNRGCD